MLTRIIIILSLLVMVSACFNATNSSSLTCSDGVDVALELVKTQMKEAVTTLRGEQIANIVINQPLELKNITPTARDNEIPYIACEASIIGWTLKDEPEIDESSGRTWWELDESSEPQEFKRISYSVHILEDSADSLWISLLSS